MLAKGGWHIQFLEADLRTPLPLKLMSHASGAYLRSTLRRRDRWHRDSSSQKHPMLTGVRIATWARNSTVCLDSAVLNNSRS